VHAAIRLNGIAELAEGFVALSRNSAGAVEVYGESRSRPVFSAEFELTPERASMLALSELRLAPDTAPRTLEEILPKPEVNPVTNDLSRNALPYATALAGACPRLTPAANVLPPEHRRFNSRAVFIPTMVLAALLLLVAGAMVVYSSWSEKEYLKQINAEIAKLEPLRRRADAIDKQTEQARARAQLLDQFRKQTHTDLDALNELTRLIEPPDWTNAITLDRAQVHINGDAPQTAPLPKLLDSTPFFEKTEIQASAPRPSGGESFQIKTNRRRGK
jgi:Tfp pilus assembly protein PilN